MKIIFLDVDGVINTINKKKELEQINPFVDWDFNNIFCKRSLRNLKNITEKTYAKIVLISARRFSPSLIEPLRLQFMEYGLWNNLIDKTPEVDSALKHGQGKELEIKAWMNNKGNINQFIILDDFAHFFNSLKPNLVEVNPHEGITDVVMHKCIDKLNEGGVFSCL